MPEFQIGWKAGFKKPSSFRGYKFFIQSYESTFGRKSVEHEFPLQDIAVSQDFGRLKRTYSIEAYVLGDDYLLQRDLLIQACEVAGPGSLYHPYYGLLNVIAKPVKVREVNSETRICYLSFEFIEVKENLLNPIRIIDPKSNLLSIQSSVMDAANQAFLKVYKIVNAPFAVVKQANRALSSAFSIIEGSKKLASSFPEFQRELKKAKDGIVRLLFSPVEMSKFLIDLVSFGSDSDTYDEASADKKFKELIAMGKSIPVTTQQTESPSDSINLFMKQISVISAANFVISFPYSSYDQAVLVRNTVVDEINNIILTIGIDDNLYSDFQDLREAVVRYNNEVASNLSQLVSLEIPISLPAIVLSNDLYGVTDKEQDILNRNEVDHPGFIPGNKPIEVVLNV